MIFVRIRRSQTKLQKRSRMIILAAVLLVLIFAGATTAIAASNIISTTVIFDGGSVEVSSLSSDPMDIVSKAGAVLETGDKLELESFAPKEENSTITVLRAYNVMITDSDKPPVSLRVCGTVADALKMANITLNEADTVNYAPESRIADNMSVVITRAFNVKVTVDGKSMEYDVTNATVSDLLKKAGVSLSKNDSVSHALSEKVFPGMEILIGKVMFKNITETEKIEFSTEEQNTDKLYVGQTQIGREGEQGERTNYYTCKYVDGKQIDKQLVMTKVTKAPISRVILRGTKPIPSYGAASASGVISQLAPPYNIELDVYGRPKNYKKRIVGEATAYSNDPITATGQKTIPGRIAVDPKEIPYGTKMYIVSCDGKYVYGYCEASDTGGFVHKSDAIADLYFNTEEECIQFGRRDIEIYILEQ